ncbi:hypothetical protein [Arsenicicoccus bolidensis]|uniref:Glycosyltransferase RgtA/B/C/D-like domain-containing protein n=1 Tax=Arsenicicoccus bolidensis TaxID=229480 RepID=A0ABS9Q5C3_9MICO|nr:hypothetical protein [Arsenicicoccus bolidensis]MCG7323084.1 hypothetical protein [Arsenicicoccus bolidensis]
MPAPGTLAPTVVVRLVGACLVAVAVAQLVSPLRGYQHHHPVLVAAVVVLLLALLAGLRARRAAPPVPRLLGRPWRTALFAAVVTGLHAWAIRYPYGWDAGYLSGVARAMELGQPLDPQQALYLSHYPINLPVLDALRLAMAVHRVSGFPVAATTALISAVVTGVVVLVTGSLLARPIGSVNASATWAGTIASSVALVLVGLNPWMSVMYSDQLALVFPVLVVWLVVRWSTTRSRAGAIVVMVLAGLCVGVGGSVKATVLVVLVAVVLGLALCPRPPGRGTRDVAVAIVVLALTGVGATVVAPHVWRAASGAAPWMDGGREMPVERWLWVGLTPSRRSDGTVVNGTYNARIDVALRPLPTAEARRVSREGVTARVRELGPSGLVAWEVGKVRWNLSDGMFTAYGEGQDPRTAETEALSAPWWEVPARWLSAPGGGGHAGRGAATQALWVSTMLVAGVGCLTVRRARVDALTTSLALGVAGIVAFTALMEARPRYVLVYAPVLVLLAARTCPAATRSPAPQVVDAHLR